MQLERYPVPIQHFATAVMYLISLGWTALVVWAYSFEPSLKYLPWLLIFSSPGWLFTSFLIYRLAVMLRRRHSAHMSGKCRNCGYDVRGNAGPTCPECGSDTTQTSG